jgi:hypothetical protein
LLGAFLARVPLDHVLDRGCLFVLLVLGLDHGDVLDGIVPPVQTQQQGGGGQLAGTPNHPLQKLRRAFLAMLATGAQLQLQAVAFLAQISRHRRITVHALVGVRDPLLLRLGVVEGRDIAIERHQVIVQGSETCTAAAQKHDGCFL